MADKQREFTVDETFDKFTSPELCEKLQTGSLLTRARAMAVLSRRCAQNPELLNTVSKAIKLQENMNARVMGMTTVSNIGIYVLLTTGNEACVITAKQIIDNLEEKEHDDVLFWLEHVMKLHIN